MPVLLPHVNVMREQLARCMSHQETEVKIAGLSATTSFIRELEEDSDRNKFQDLIPVMLQTVSSILSTEEQDSAEEALEAFIEIAEAHPTFLRRQLDVVVNNMLQACISQRHPPCCSLFVLSCVHLGPNNFLGVLSYYIRGNPLCALVLMCALHPHAAFMLQASVHAEGTAKDCCSC